jgi:hypothetical protein
MTDDADYVCDACGETIIIPVDASQGARQSFIEDCPVCCRPNEICIELNEDGEGRVTSSRAV